MKCFLISKNELLISGSSDKTIKIWNLNSGECVKTLQGHTNEINSIQLISDVRIISCSSDGFLKEWDLDSSECVKTFKGHSNSIFCIQLLANKLLF